MSSGTGVAQLRRLVTEKVMVTVVVRSRKTDGGGGGGDVILQPAVGEPESLVTALM